MSPGSILSFLSFPFVYVHAVWRRQDAEEESVVLHFRKIWSGFSYVFRFVFCAAVQANMSDQADVRMMYMFLE